MPSVFLNGVFVERGAAMVSAFDAGFQHGVGLFETMLAVRRGDGWEVLDVDAHLDRLAGSCRELRLTERLRVDALREAVTRAVVRAGEEEKEALRLRLRLTITGGDLNLLQSSRAVEQQSSRESGKAAERPAAAGELRGKEEEPFPKPLPSGEGLQKEQQPTLLIVATKAVEYPAPMFEKGVRVTIADWKANPLDPMQGHKTLNYWGRLRELQGAGARGAAEALVFQVSNYLCGGCVSNAMVVKDGRIVTPIVRGEELDGIGNHEEHEGHEEEKSAGRAVLPSPVLPGVTRRWAIDWAEGNGIEVERRMVNIDDVLSADEVLLTNSSWGVLPVAAVESRVIGAGRPGEVGGRLVEAWRARVG